MKVKLWWRRKDLAIGPSKTNHATSRWVDEPMSARYPNFKKCNLAQANFVFSVEWGGVSEKKVPDIGCGSSGFYCLSGRTTT